MDNIINYYKIWEDDNNELLNILREPNGDYNIDDKYMGSGTNIQIAIKQYGKENFKKEILFEFDNEDDMLDKEAELVNKDFILRDDTYNIVLGGGGFNRNGILTVKDKNGNIFSVTKNDPRYLSGELVHNITGLAVVKDKDGNIFSIDVNDPRYLSGEFVGINKGMVCVKDNEGNFFQVSVTDPRFFEWRIKA